MATAADILFWTKYTVTEEAAVRFSTAAETRLNLDGGSAITGELRTQLVCYLIGDMIATTAQEGTSSTERIGDYSYTTTSTTNTTADYWLKKYHTLLATFSGYASIPTSDNGGIVEREIDRQVVTMNRTFTETEYY